MPAEFVHLRLHTEYSLIDSVVRVPELVDAVSAAGMAAVAVTDQSNLFAMVKFYRAALAPIGYKVLMEVPTEFTGGLVVVGLGVPPRPDFWVNQGQPQKPHVHVAFRAETREQVDAFHRAALAAGGTDNGAPGLRPQYHAGYYGAFVLDPDGHNVEVCCHKPG